jgi:hypothetical protein
MLSLPPTRVAVLGAGLNPSEKANLYGHECREGIMCLPSSAYWLGDDDAYAVERATEPLHCRGIDPELGRRLAHAQSARTRV